MKIKKGILTLLIVISSFTILGCTDLENLLGYLEGLDVEGSITINGNNIATTTQTITTEDEKEITIIRTIKTDPDGITELENLTLVYLGNVTNLTYLDGIFTITANGETGSGEEDDSDEETDNDEGTASNEDDDSAEESPLPDIVTADGISTITYSDGTIVVSHSNGTIIVTKPDSSVVTLTPDGTNSVASGCENDAEFTEISTAEELQAIDLDRKYCLTNDIDLAGIDDFAPLGYPVDNPIVGTDRAFTGTAFMGTLDGNNKKISGLNIEKPSNNFIGLFAKIGADGEVKDLTIEEPYIHGNSYVGVLAGQNVGTITNVEIVGETNVTIVKGNGEETGGLIGSNNGNGTIKNSSVTGKLEGNRNVGGIAGYTGNSSNIDNCSVNNIDLHGEGYIGGLVGANYGDIDNSHATGVVGGGNEIGGLAGWSSGDITKSYANTVTRGVIATGGIAGQNRGTIENSYATGRVIGTGGSTGGIAGRNGGSITNSYAAATVEGTIKTGGLVGWNNIDPPHGYNGSITNSYATGLVTGTEGETGGLVGWNDNENNNAVSIENSYFDKAGTGRENAVGDGDASGAEGINVSDIDGGGSNPFESNGGWDFADTWKALGDGIWPVLEWVETATETNGTISVESGCASDTEFTIIATAEELRNITDLTGKYCLFNDINLNDADFEPLGYPDTPITGDNFTETEFAGTFDGNGNKIIGLIIRKNDDNFIGLFAKIGARGLVKDLIFSEPIVEGNSYVGALAGENRGTVRGVNVVNGRIEASEDNVGGLLGSNDNGTISDIDINANVTGRDIVGGVIGRNYKGSVDLESIAHSAGSITEGGVSSTALIGLENDCDDNTIPIYNEDDLQNITDFAGDYCLVQDITLTGESFEPLGYPDTPITGDYDQEFTGTAFTGTFDGNGKTIRGLIIRKEDNNFIGLFAKIGARGLVKDLIFSEPIVEGNSYVGALAGESEGTITNVRIEGQSDVVIVKGEGNYTGGLVGWNEGPITGSYATGAVEGGSHTGGLVGHNAGGTITNSYATGEVDGNNYIGGLVGWNLNGRIENSYATGEINGRNDGGGLVGRNHGTIINSYATGEVNGSDYIGGLVGVNSQTITGSYATGEVDGNNYIGGLVGHNGGLSNVAVITGSYATGEVTGRGGGTGGLVGANRVTIRGSYFGITTTGQENGVGSGSDSGVTGLRVRDIDADGLDPFESWGGWDFVDTWRAEGNRRWPVFQWQPVE